MRRAAVAVALLALAACSHEGQHLSGAQTAAEAAPTSSPHAATVANPHEGGGDPHSGTPAPAAKPASTAPVDWTVPDGWKGGASTRPMRVAEFDVGADESGAALQCVVYSGIGGDDAQNLERWIGQMGEDAKAGAKTTHAEHDGLTITRLEAHGSYTDAMGRGEPKVVATATMLAAIVDGPAGKLHVKLVGPSSVVDAAAAKFDAFLASMKPK